MRVHIDEKHENALLKRQDIKFSVKETNTTPSRQELRKQIAALTNADEKKIVVDTLKTRFGSTDLSGNARIYKEAADMKKTELSYVMTRNFGKEEKKEAKAEEKPAEAKK